MLWRFAGRRSDSQTAERRAQQLIAASFALIAAYVAVRAALSLAAGQHPQSSWAGVVLAAFTLAAMPPLARAKRRVAKQLGSAATASEGRQNMVCAYLAAALLVGLLGNVALGLWWVDPVVALTIAGVAVRESRQAWRGQQCSCC